MLKKFSKACFISTALLFAANGALALDTPTNKIVDAKWLKENIADKDIVIIDVREDKDAYKIAHIPNAVYWKIDDFREQRFDLPGFISSPTAFKRLAQKSGITPKSAVVFYSDGLKPTSYTIATLSLYISEYYGITNTAILNGGFASWQKAGFETMQEKSKIEKSKFDISKFNSEILATSYTMDEAVELSNYSLIDARPLAQFSGEKKHAKAKKNGHVPGASHVFVGSLTYENDGVYFINTDKNKIEKLLNEAKVDPKKPNIWYCNTGWFASGGWFVDKYIAGHADSKIYEASMVEYTSLPKRKIEK